MQQSTGKPDADPQWFAKAVHHYALIKDGAHTIRSLAREKIATPPPFCAKHERLKGSPIQRLCSKRFIVSERTKMRCRNIHLPLACAALRRSYKNYCIFWKRPIASWSWRKIYPRPSLFAIIRKVVPNKSVLSARKQHRPRQCKA